MDFGSAERMVRINQLPLGYQDLEEVIPERPDIVLIPKVEHPQQVLEVDRKISDIETQRRNQAADLADADIGVGTGD